MNSSATHAASFASPSMTPGLGDRHVTSPRVPPPLDEILSRQRDSRVSPKVIRPVVATMGIHVAGKDTILTALAQIEGEHGSYTKVPYWTDRQRREGDDLRRNPGAVQKGREDFLRPGQRYTFWYRSYTGSFYAFPPEVFDVEGVPTLHIADPQGYLELEVNGTLPSLLPVLIDVTNEADMRDRLSRRGGSSDDLHRLTTQSHSIAMDFRRRKWYAAQYTNNRPEEDDLSALFFPGRLSAEEATIRGIAMRLDNLYNRHANGVIMDESPLDPRQMHTDYIDEVVKTLFGAERNRVRGGRKPDYRVALAARNYAARAGLDNRPLNHYLRKVRVASKQTHKGEVSIVLARQDSSNRPIYVDELRRSWDSRSPHPHSDYQSLQILGEAAYRATSTRPMPIVEDGELIGIRYSLTDARPARQKSGQVHALNLVFPERK